MITDALRRQARLRPNGRFLTCLDYSITYSQMVRLVDAAASRLSSRVTAGCRVAILCGNRPAFLVAWFAVNELGAIGVLLNTAFVGSGLRYTVEHSGCNTLLVDAALWQSKSSDLAAFPTKSVVILDESFELSPANVRPTTELGSSLVEASTILFTSGTTGHPKGVVIPGGSYRAAGIDMVKASGMNSSDRILVFLPMFHANPQMYALMPAMECGAELILVPRFSASSFIDQARRSRATAFTYVGSVLSILAARHVGDVRDHELRWCVGGGAPEKVWVDIEARFGIAVRELYGMTETGGWVSMNTAGSTKLGSVGRPREDVELAIMHDGRVLPAMATGEIVARALRPEVFFTEYWSDALATAEVLRDGWLHTGDRGSIDESGYLFFRGRVKDLIRRGGEMISPVEVESALLTHPAVGECVVAGIADEIMGEEIVAAVVLRSPATATELQRFLEQRIAAHMIPRQFIFVDTLPRTETTKIKRYAVAKLVEQVSEDASDIARTTADPSD
jgi:long-chain acyl-CoA synthetase